MSLKKNIAFPTVITLGVLLVLSVSFSGEKQLKSDKAEGYGTPVVAYKSAMLDSKTLQKDSEGEWTH